MKREARLLLSKAVDSLILSIEHFNRPWDRGRVDAVLILLDHSFEMLLKAAILHRGGAIRRPREKQTIGFDESLRKALSDSSVQFLKQERSFNCKRSTRSATLRSTIWSISLNNISTSTPKLD